MPHLQRPGSAGIMGRESYISPQILPLLAPYRLSVSAFLLSRLACTLAMTEGGCKGSPESSKGSLQVIQSSLIKV